MMKHKFLAVTLLVVGFIMVVVLGSSVYMISYSLIPSNNRGRDYTKAYARLFTRFPDIKSWVDSLQSAGAIRDTFIMGQDGDRHHALLIAASHRSNRTAVVVHGYTDCAVDFLNIARIYNHDMGFNVLLPDLHACGKSDGKAQQMGWLDRLDVLQWINIADSLWRDSARQSEIVVHGVSMGAAATMCVAGDTTIPAVKCFVEDCGYTSVWDEFAAQMKEQFGLPEFPLMYVTSALCKIKFGWSFGEASPLEQVRKCRKPMLFIHGGKDSYVPTRMVYPLYDAKPAPKELIVFRNTKHARSYSDYPLEYKRIVKRFVNRYIK
jgi:cell surface hydrolase